MQNRPSPLAALAASLRTRLTRLLVPCAGMLVALAAGSPAMAQSAAPAAPAAVKSAETTNTAVTLKLTQQKVVKGTDGKEKLLDAATVKPGDLIEYKVVYTNRSAKAVSGLVANLPIPEGLQYVPNSAKPGATVVQAATKDRIYAAEPLTRKVGTKTEPVPYAEYRMLRWTLGVLPANGEAAVTARATVQTYVAPAAGTPAAAASLAQASPVTVVRTPAKP